MPQQEHDVAAADQLSADGMLPIEVDGEKILLLRDGDCIRAIGAECPHAGAPLNEGVRHAGRIICPWHKATFCIRTGALLEPPAVDHIPAYDVREAGGRILLTLPARDRPTPPARQTDKTFVMIGGGAAGAVAAQTLREEGFAGRIVMLDRENRVPYDRTLLSKYYLSGENGAEKTPLQSQAFYMEQNIERRTAEVLHIDAQQRRITCAGGMTIGYDKALLATGATPTRPDLPGLDRDGVFLLRSRADAEAILARAERSTRAVVLGASFIGMEVAASLRERGLAVTVVGAEQTPFGKLLGPDIGAAFTMLHQRRGVTFRLGAKVTALQGDTEVTGVLLEGGEILPAELVVIGFGVRPATVPIEGVTLNDDGGLPVDAWLRAADDLHAAGDVASFPHHGAPIRVEHWRVAQQHGRVAALNMLGRPTRYDAVPVFWTIQYLKRLDYIGHAKDWDELVVHGDLEAPEFLAYYVKDGRVAAAAGLDRDRDTAALIELFALRHDWTAAELGERPAEVLAHLTSSARDG